MRKQLGVITLMSLAAIVLCLGIALFGEYKIKMELCDTTFAVDSKALGEWCNINNPVLQEKQPDVTRS